MHASAIASTTRSLAPRRDQLFQDSFIARKPLKGSSHTEAAYRGDLATISAQLAADLGRGRKSCAWGQVTWNPSFPWFDGLTVQTGVIQNR
jgi:hypothetical protein